MFCIDDGLKIKRTDWYLHLKTKELDDHIQTAVRHFEELEMMDINYRFKLSMDIGSPEHGQLIDSHLSEELYSLYRHAQIISEASVFIRYKECQV